MKKVILFLCIIASGSLFNDVKGQACVNTVLGANCTRSSVYAGEILPASCGVNSNVSNFSPANYFRIPVLTGACYTISTCGAPTDGQLSAFQGLVATTGQYAYNDDNGPDCAGAAASMVIVPTFTDYTTIDLREYNCQAGGTSSITIYVRQNNNLSCTFPTTNMCQGQTRALTATPAPVGSAQPNSGNLGTFSGAGVSGTTFTAPVPAGSNGIYTITYTYGYCSTTSNITVYRNPSTANAGSNFNAACGATTASLNATTPTYGTGIWSVVSGTGSVTTALSPTSGVTGLTPGTSSTFRWTVTNGPCTSSFSDVTVTVPNFPTITASASPSATGCVGSLVTLTGGGGLGYSWTGGVTNGVPFAIAGTQTYTVTGTDINGCTNTATQTVTALTNPVVVGSASPNDSTCAGGSITLTGGGAISYVWTGGATNAIPFIPASSGTYTVTGTASNGCTATATQSITVNPLPSVSSTIVPSATVCEGINVTINGTGASSYSWTGGILNGVPFPATSTTTYTVTGTSAFGCTNTATRLVTVNPAPIIGVSITPSDSVCPGTSVNLSGTGAVIFTWTGGITDGVSFVPASTQTYTVTGTGGNGCTSTTAQTITVNPLPTVGATVSPSPVVCSGTNVTLNGTGAFSYSWTGGATNNVAFPAVSSLTYTVTGTDLNSCTNTSTLSLTVNSLPSVSFNFTTDSVCSSYGLVNLSGSSPAGGTYSGTNVSGTTFDPASLPLGFYPITYSYTDVNLCNNTSTDSILVSACLSIEDMNNDDLVLYPNPSTGKFFLSIKNDITGTLDVFIIDLHGKTVYKSQSNKTEVEFIKEIDISEEADGIYFLHIALNGGQKITKRIIKH